MRRMSSTSATVMAGERFNRIFRGKNTEGAQNPTPSMSLC